MASSLGFIVHPRHSQCGFLQIASELFALYGHALKSLSFVLQACASEHRLVLQECRSSSGSGRRHIYTHLDKRPPCCRFWLDCNSVSSHHPPGNVKATFASTKERCLYHGGWRVLDVIGDYFLVSVSALNASRSFALLGKFGETGVSWTAIGEDDEPEQDEVQQLVDAIDLSIIATPIQDTHTAPVNEGILLLPPRAAVQDSSQKKPPLIVYPHGGPHTVCTTGFISQFIYFCIQGYAMLLGMCLNYEWCTHNR